MVVLRQQLMRECKCMAHMLNTEPPERLNPADTLTFPYAFWSSFLGLCPRMIRLLTEQFLIPQVSHGLQRQGGNFQSHEGKYIFPFLHTLCRHIAHPRSRGEGLRLYLDGKSAKTACGHLLVTKLSMNITKIFIP